MDPKPHDPVRRCDTQRMTPEELLILDAMRAVEKLPADVRLTHAVVMLTEAMTAVADYVDGVAYEDEGGNTITPAPKAETTVRLEVDAKAAAEVLERAATSLSPPKLMDRLLSEAGDKLLGWLWAHGFYPGLVNGPGGLTPPAQVLPANPIQPWAPGRIGDPIPPWTTLGEVATGVIARHDVFTPAAKEG